MPVLHGRGCTLAAGALVGLTVAGSSSAQPPREPPPYGLWALALDRNTGTGSGDPKALRS